MRQPARLSTLNPYNQHNRGRSSVGRALVLRWPGVQTSLPFFPSISVLFQPPGPASPPSVPSTKRGGLTVTVRTEEAKIRRTVVGRVSIYVVHHENQSPILPEGLELANRTKISFGLGQKDSESPTVGKLPKRKLLPCKSPAVNFDLRLFLRPGPGSIDFFRRTGMGTVDLPVSFGVREWGPASLATLRIDLVFFFVFRGPPAVTAGERTVRTDCRTTAETTAVQETAPCFELL